MSGVSLDHEDFASSSERLLIFMWNKFKTLSRTLWRDCTDFIHAFFPSPFLLTGRLKHFVILSNFLTCIFHLFQDQKRSPYSYVSGLGLEFFLFTSFIQLIRSPPFSTVISEQARCPSTNSSLMSSPPKQTPLCLDHFLIYTAVKK